MKYESWFQLCQYISYPIWFLLITKSDAFSIKFSKVSTSSAIPSSNIIHQYSVHELPLVAPICLGAWRSSLISRKASNNRKQGINDMDDELDIPEDWNEDDILAEFDGDEVVVGDEDDDVGDGVEEVRLEATSLLPDGTKSIDDEDDDDEFFDLDEIDLDEEEEEEMEESELVVVVEQDENRGESLLYAEEDEAWNVGTKGEEGATIIPWDPDEDGIEYELQDDLTDPNYTQQKEIVQQAIAQSNARTNDDTFDAFEYVQQTEFTPEQIAALDRLPIFQAVEDMVQDMNLDENDLMIDNDDDDLEKKLRSVTDIMTDDPYPRHTNDNELNLLQEGTGLTDDDMEELDTTYKEIVQTLSQEPWDKVMLSSWNGFEGLSNETINEIENCLEELGGSAYNVTNWLLYDLQFNVSNLILAAVQHNPDAPILFQHWYPQLVTYRRYQHARDRNYDFTWDDVQQADITELERYYAGFGYDSIPSKAPSETGIISLEDLDEEEIKMAAFENWMTDVYNPESDRKDFDDDTLRDEDNVFSEYYEAPQHPDLPLFEDAVDDLNEWKEELGEAAESKDPEIVNYRNMMGQSFDYTVTNDEEFVREFRGHLVIACTGYDTDLEIAEKITKRFKKEFGKKIFVETRVMALARDEDNVFEIWLESYDIDLLHSKKRATSNTKGWDGPADVDEKQIDYLTERVRFLISDDARYSYRLELEFAD